MTASPSSSAKLSTSTGAVAAYLRMVSNTSDISVCLLGLAKLLGLASSLGLTDRARYLVSFRPCLRRCDQLHITTDDARRRLIQIGFRLNCAAALAASLAPVRTSMNP